MAKKITGYNAGDKNYPIYQIREGQSYDEIRKLYDQIEKTGQTYVDPNSLAVWAIKKGYQPSFGDENYIKRNIPNYSPGVVNQEGTQKLIDKVLLEAKNIDNLQQHDWWNSSPFKKQAYEQLQTLTQDPNQMAKYVKDKGLTNLKGYSWWNTLPNKKEVYSIIETLNKQDTPQKGVLDTPSDNQTNGPTLPDDGTFPGEITGPAPGTPEQPGVPDDPGTGDFKFTTGNPELDEFLNGTYLKIIEDEVNSLADPNAILNEDVFKQIKDRVDKAWGPVFQNELNLVNETFDRSKAQLDANKTETERSLSTTLSRGTEDFGTQRSRTLQDVGIQKERIVRNYQDALSESQQALASRGLAFGGTRVKEEGRIEEYKQRDLSDLERNSQRTLDDLTTQQARLGSDVGTNQDFLTGQYGRDISGLTSGLEQQKKSLEGEKTIQYADERKRLRDLGAYYMQNPEFRSIT